MEVVHVRCAGLDVHKKTVTACRLRPAEGSAIDREIKTFGTMTEDLLRLVDWLREWEITHVVMESAGDYWKPIFNLLEGGFGVLLVNAQHVKHVPGRKTDVQDAKWLADLLRHGLLRASFIPPAPQRDLRDLTRYRTTLVQERAREVNRVQKLLESANIKLASVASDTLGMSGRAMLEALVAGQADPTALADLAQGKLRSKLDQLQKALTGVVRPHHRFLLAQQLAHIDFLEEQIRSVGEQIQRYVEAMSQDSPSGSADSSPGHSPSPTSKKQDTPLSAVEAIALLDTIPGVDERIAQGMIAEMGLDMDRFPSDRHLASWAGLAPGNYESAGKRYSGRTRQGSKALRTTLSQATWAASRTKDTYLSAQYHQLASRRGAKRAAVAVAHSIIVIAYHMLLRREPYRELGGNYFDERKKESVVNRLLRRIEKLGYSAHVEPLTAAA